MHHLNSNLLTVGVRVRRGGVPDLASEDSLFCSQLFLSLNTSFSKIPKGNIFGPLGKSQSSSIENALQRVFETNKGHRS